jgi:phosphoglycolate phosphatase-like HAD superfamily hydrolase
VKHRYLEFSSPEGICYIRNDRLRQLREVDVVVFDCDGVLLDVRGSYSGAAAESASIILEALTGTRVNASVFDGDVFFAFKKTGHFNNDWSVTYAYVMGALSTLTDSELSALDATAAKVEDGSPSERLNKLREIRSPSHLKQILIKACLIKLAESTGAGGVDFMDALLLPRIDANVKKLLRYRGSVGESVVSTLFEEIFGGAKLFQETFGLRAQFTDEQAGYIEKEKLVLSTATIQKMEELLNSRRLGVASGSLMNSARHALGHTIDIFPRNAQVWYEDVDAASKGTQNLHKPNGYSLLQVAKAYAPYRRVIYVGDTVADLLTTRNADEQNSKFSFLGVYATSARQEATREMFLSLGADAVAPTVNQLPLIIQRARADRDPK